MGCVSSNLLNQDEELGSSSLGHHIVSLTSTTYGFLTGLDNAPSSPAAAAATRFTTTTTTLFPSPLSESRAIRSEPEVINSWELMAGLDSNDSFRFSPLPNSNSNSRPSTPKFFKAAKPRIQSKTAAPADKENCQPNCIPIDESSNSIPKPLDKEQGVCQKFNDQETNSLEFDGFAKVCPPNGEDRVVLYTTTLRGVRRTFEACNAVRSAIQALGFSFSERDISMDRGFRDELNHLRIQHNKLHSSTSTSTSTSWAPPQLFIKGSYVGGAEEVLRIHEEGGLAYLLQGLPRINPGLLCDGCGGFSFLPCFRCHGSCKLSMALVVSNSKTTAMPPEQSITTTSLVMRCPDCNENGLVLCPICT